MSSYLFPQFHLVELGKNQFWAKRTRLSRFNWDAPILPPQNPNFAFICNQSFPYKKRETAAINDLHLTKRFSLFFRNFCLMRFHFASFIVDFSRFPLRLLWALSFDIDKMSFHPHCDINHRNHRFAFCSREIFHLIFNLLYLFVEMERLTMQFLLRNRDKFNLGFKIFWPFWQPR